MMIQFLINPMNISMPMWLFLLLGVGFAVNSGFLGWLITRFVREDRREREERRQAEIDNRLTCARWVDRDPLKIRINAQNNFSTFADDLFRRMKLAIDYPVTAQLEDQQINFVFADAGFAPGVLITDAAVKCEST